MDDLKMIIEHYTQTIDLGENGQIECTRDDTPEEGKLHFIAWKDGKKTHERKKSSTNRPFHQF